MFLFYSEKKSQNIKLHNLTEENEKQNENETKKTRLINCRFIMRVDLMVVVVFGHKSSGRLYFFVCLANVFGFVVVVVAYI